MTYNEFINLLENKNIEKGEFDYKDFIKSINNMDEIEYIKYIHKYISNLKGYSKLPLALLYPEPRYVCMENRDRTMVLFRMIQDMEINDTIQLMKLALYSFRLKDLKLWNVKNLDKIKHINYYALKTLSENFYNMVTSKNLPYTLSHSKIYNYNEEPVLIWCRTLYTIASMSGMNGFKSIKTVETMYNAFKKEDNNLGKQFVNNLLSFLVKQDKKKYSAKVMEIKLS